MSEMNAPNLAAELLRIHSIITRGLRVAIEHSQSSAERRYPSIAMREGFVCYIRSFVSVLDVHHDTEDRLAFPYFKGKFPDAPYDLLMTQHKSIVLILDELNTIIEEMAAHMHQGEVLNDLFLVLKRIDEIWHPHIQIEEENFTADKLETAIPPDEQIRLIKLFMEHSQQHAKPDFLVVPFLLYNLPPEQRTAFAGAMPPVVTEQLVPVVWKEKWEPMKPFLLA